MKKLIICLSIVVLVGLVGSFVCFSGDSLTPRDLGVSFRVPAEEFYPGDIFYVSVDIKNPTQETFRDIPLFVIWGAGRDVPAENALYFPVPPGEWRPGDVNYYTIDVPPGNTEMEIIAPVVWPLTPEFDGCPITFVTGMSDPFFTTRFGSEDWLTFYIH